MYTPDEIKEMTIDLDTPFQFKCRGCGKCCKNRHDIILKSRDLFRIAKYLGKTTQEVVSKYCDVFPGSDSYVPIVCLKAVDVTEHCPFMLKRKCAIHPVKPEICALYPLGRYIDVRDGDEVIQYLLQPQSCGGLSRTHTPRQWLERFDIPVDDQFYLRWTHITGVLAIALRSLADNVWQVEQRVLFNIAYRLMYRDYQTDMDFEPQFDRNMDMLLEDIKRLAPEALDRYGKE